MSDEGVRHAVRTRWGSPAVAPGPRRTVDLDPAEALRLLAGVSLGRIVFTRHALPAIRPVNHVVVAGDVIIHTHEAAALTEQVERVGAQGIVVAYEADVIDADTHLGWSVVVTGYCRLITDPRDTARYRELVRPWADQRTDVLVRLHPDLVSGIRLTGPS
ncbi:pyridoxamine 5'-phosphate oxidase family protein [Actinacidiphila sp. ITFR-21]|uniref:pyridoxamine 5'-phosphate oxidase family protein n=1 Tax=Actinacidiphila sp. ITFR-21 TaxID=3075199 RepID=UPI00288B4FA6|nr:pyridoxamine 5'-phosphate oxidase family protein [Streptomyces sp. ITFR-21]WNI14283.1 pyridoxamine 5'-phosphate oxidase family protein [Streptomyces sp. ITFR-21]